MIGEKKGPGGRGTTHNHNGEAVRSLMSKIFIRGGGRRGLLEGDRIRFRDKGKKKIGDGGGRRKYLERVVFFFIVRPRC